MSNINPLDYVKNPIGALKTEMSFWIFGLITIAPWVTYFISPFLMVFFGLMGWLRLSYLISHHLEEKKEIK